MTDQKPGAPARQANASRQCRIASALQSNKVLIIMKLTG